MYQSHNRCIRCRFHRAFSHISTITHRHSHQHFRAHYIKRRVHTRNHSFRLLCNRMPVANTGARLLQRNHNISKWVEFLIISSLSYRRIFNFETKIYNFFSAIAISFVSSFGLWLSATTGMASIELILPLPAAKMNATILRIWWKYGNYAGMRGLQKCILKLWRYAFKDSENERWQKESFIPIWHRDIDLWILRRTSPFELLAYMH